MTEIVEMTETKAAFARRLGVSPNRVSALVKAGLPLTDDGKVKINSALAWVEARQNPVRSAAGRLTGARRRVAEPDDADDADDADDDAPPPKDAPDYWEWKAKREKALAERAAVALAKDRAEVVDRATVARVVGDFARAERDAWQSWAARIAPVIASEVGADVRRLSAAIDREVARHLHELADAKPPEFLP